MKKFILVFLILCKAADFVSAQNIFQKTFGGSQIIDQGVDIIPADSNNYLLCGMLGMTGYWFDGNIFLLDSIGNTIWDKVYAMNGVIGLGQIEKVIKPLAGGFIVTGYIRGTPTGGFLAGLNQNGNVVWMKIYNDAWFKDVKQTADSGLIIVGGYSSGFYAVKLTAVGALDWAVSFNPPNDMMEALSVTESSAGDFLLAGLFSGSHDNDICLVNISSGGALNYSMTYGGSGNEYADGVIATSDSGFIVAGTIDTSGTDADIFLLKLDKAGDVQWLKTYGGPSTESCQQIIQDQNGDLLLACYTESFGQNNNGLLIKTDIAGNILWSKVYKSGYLNAAKQASDGGYILAGGFNNDIQIIKTDSNGSSGCNEINVSLQVGTISSLPVNFTPFFTQVSPIIGANYPTVTNYMNHDQSIICSSVGISEPPEEGHDFSAKLKENIASLSFVSAGSEEMQFTLTDLEGRILSRNHITAYEGRNRREIKVNAVAPGIYVITLHGATFNSSLKVIRE